YAALIVNRIIGTNTEVFTERDGLQRSLVQGPDAPTPGWLPVLPRSLVVQAGHWLPSPGRQIAGDLELLTHGGLEEVKRFYLETLREAGFDIRDTGFGTLNAPSASYLGIANILEGYRSGDDLTISVTTRTPDGIIFPSRVVQIHWQKWDKSLLGENAAVR